MRKYGMWMMTGTIILSGLTFCTGEAKAESLKEPVCIEEQMELLQEGGFAIPEHDYSYDGEYTEQMNVYLAAEETTSIEEKQQAAEEARADGNATLQERMEQCAETLYSGMVQLETQIDVAQFALTREEFKAVISDVVNSNPELFYIRNGYKINTFKLSDETTEIVNYCIGFYEYQDEKYIPQREKIQELINQLEEKKDSICGSVIKTGMSHMEKALMIHEYLVLNTEYDYANSKAYEEDPANNPLPDSDCDVYGTLINGRAVCQGYSLAYKYLMEACGIEDIGFAESTSHIWNTITLDGAGYYVDCTWDDPVRDTLGNVKHTYFLKGEESFKNHTIEKTDRECSGTSYDDMFWDDVYSGILYYEGNYYYIGTDGYLYRRKLQGLTDSERVADLELTETADWTYKNAAKLALAKGYAVYHDEKNLYACNLKNGEKKKVYTPTLVEDELIYGLAVQGDTFYYATRKQAATEQEVYSYTLPDSPFYIPVEQIQISGSQLLHLRMNNGVLTGERTDLKAEVLPENASNKRIQKWISSDTSVAVVDINGRVKVVSPGVTTISAVSYDGVMGTYTIKVVLDGNIITDNGDVLYYEEGKLLANQFYQIDGNYYYLGADGKKVTGWQEIGGKKYYFNENGIMLTGWQLIDGKRYYLSIEGAMMTGWQTIQGIQYYFDQNGIMLTGWQTIAGKQYYFNAEGALTTVGWQTIEAKRYYFNMEGVMLTGWQTIDGKRYYFGKDGVMTIGWKTINKKKYYFNKKGVMSTGWKTINKKKYYFNKKGVMSTGWKTINKKRYYFNKKGVMSTGWKTIDKKKYYFDKKGVMKKGLQVIDGISYYFAQDGHLVS